MTTPDVGSARPNRGPVWRPGLFVAGVLLFVAPFLYANPFNGSQRRVWPWEIWTESTSWDQRTELAGIALVAVGAITAGIGVGRTRLLEIVATLAAFFAIRLHGEAATFSLLSVERLGLSWFAAGLVLGVGLLVLSKREGGTRQVGALLTVLGSVWILTFLVAWFPRDTSAQGRSMLEYYIRRVPDFWNALILRGEADSSARTAIIPLAWSQVVPTVFLAASVVLGLIAAICARLLPSGVRRGLAGTAFVAYLCTWLVPLASALVMSIDAERPGVGGVVGTIGNALLDAGMALWLVLAYSIAAIVREPVDSARVDTLSLPCARSAFDRWVFAVAFLLGIASLLAHFHPRAGIAAHLWPTEMLRRFRWNSAGSALVFHVLFLALTLAAGVTRPARGTGWLFVAGFGLALVALEGPVRDETELRRFLFRAPPYVPFVLAGIAAGAGASAARGSADRWRKGIALAAGLTVLALLLYPVASPIARRGIGAPAEMDPYASVLTTGWAWAKDPIEFLLGFEPRFGCPMLTTLLALVGALAVAASLRRPGRVRRVLSWVVFGFASAWPLIQLVGGTIRRGADEGASFALRLANAVVDPDLPLQCVAAVSFFYLPTAWAAAGLVVRGLRRDPIPGGEC